jgi:hypothetical protein
MGYLELNLRSISTSSLLASPCSKRVRTHLAGVAPAGCGHLSRSRSRLHQISKVLHPSFHAPAGVNGASLPNRTARRRGRQPNPVNVRSGRRACCNRVQWSKSTAKWRFGPSKKRHFAPDSATFLAIFPVFFPATAGGPPKRCNFLSPNLPNCKVMTAAAVFLRWER